MAQHVLACVPFFILLYLHFLPIFILSTIDLFIVKAAKPLNKNRQKYLDS